MEEGCFPRILLAAFILLTLTVVSGVFFSSCCSASPSRSRTERVRDAVWLIFAACSRGTTCADGAAKAVRWTLAGFVALLLAYVGSKFVLEIILRR